MFENQDPDYRGFSGIIKTDLRIGMGGLVEVEATYDDDEPQEMTITYRGLEVGDILGSEAVDEIQKHIEKNWSKLVQDAIWERKNDQY